MLFLRLKRLIVGEPLVREEVKAESVSRRKAFALYGADVLSSVAYATEEILLPLAAFVVSAAVWSIPIACGIAFLILVVSASRYASCLRTCKSLIHS